MLNGAQVPTEVRPLRRAISALLADEPEHIADDLAVRAKLGPLARYLEAEDVREVCVNRPGEVWVERSSGWSRHAEPSLGFARLRELATAVATLTGQHTDERHPLLSASLSSGERIQIVQPTATEQGIVAIALRKPSTRLLGLTELQGQGLFASVAQAGSRRTAARAELQTLLDAGRIENFLRLAVRSRQNIIVAGATGSGKTTLLKALCEEIPHAERLITIEDAAEITLPRHDNAVHLFYSKGRQGASDITAAALLEACLRLRPDRIIQAEIRGEEAFSFLDLAASGHPGSMTSIHAGSCSEAFERMALMVRKSQAGSAMTVQEIGRLARSVIDIVVHLARTSAGFEVTEVVFAPTANTGSPAVSP